MKTNYHTHTQRCLHAQGTEEDYIAAALAAGVEILGFSDHAPFPDHDYGYRMPYSELKAYFSAVDRLSKEHVSDIIIRKSLEIEFLPKYRSYYEQLLTEKKVDYLLLGEHIYQETPDRIRNITVEAESTETYLHYARAVSDALDTGYYRMVAHPDIFAMNKFAWDRNCDAACELILDAAVRNRVVIEFNANGFRRGIHQYPDGERYMYPHVNFWTKVVHSGLEVIVGSDCHNPTQVWDGCMPRGIQFLKDLGITPVDTAPGL